MSKLDSISIIFTVLLLCRAMLAMSKVSLHLSACPSVKRMNCDKTKANSAHILIPYERLIILVFQQGNWFVVDLTFCLKFWPKLNHPLQKR